MNVTENESWVVWWCSVVVVAHSLWTKNALQGSRYSFSLVFYSLILSLSRGLSLLLCGYIYISFSLRLYTADCRWSKRSRKIDRVVRSLVLPLILYAKRKNSCLSSSTIGCNLTTSSVDDDGKKQKRRTKKKISSFFFSSRMSFSA